MDKIINEQENARIVWLVDKLLTTEMERDNLADRLKIIEKENQRLRDTILAIVDVLDSDVKFLLE